MQQEPFVSQEAIYPKPQQTSMAAEWGTILQAADGTIQACDPIVERILGYDTACLIGVNSFDIPWQTIYPDGSPFPATEYPAKVALQTGKPCCNVVMGFFRANGELVWLQLNSHPLFQTDATKAYAVVTLLAPLGEGKGKGGTDLKTINQKLTWQIKKRTNQLKQANDAARQQLAELEAIYATAPIGLYFIDTDLRYLRVNEHLAQVNGVSVQSHIGRTVREILPELAAKLEPIYQQAIASGEPILNIEISGTNIAEPGVERTWLSSFYPLKQNGQVIGINGMVQEITERKSIEQALQDTEARLTRFAESDLIGILFGDIHGKINYANDEFLRIIGYSRQELLSGQISWTEITPSEWLPFDDRSIAEAQVRGACTPYEKQYIHKDGHRVWALVGYSLLGEAREELVAFILDISDRKQTEVALQESDARLKCFVDANIVGVLLADLKGNLLEANDAFLHMVGYTQDDVRSGNMRWREMTPPEWADADNRSIEQIRAIGSCPPFEKEYIRKDGSRVPILVGSSMLPGAQEVCFCFVLDLSDRKTAEIALRDSEAKYRQLAAQEQAARAEAELANRLKDEFLAVLSHELRSPLNPILGWARLLQTRRLDETKTLEALATIERNAKLQAQLIEDLLDISRIMRGKLTIIAAPVDLNFVITAALETVRLAAEAKTIQIELTLDPNVKSVFGDAGRLQQVVWNLLSNAVKFTPVGGRVEVRLMQVDTEAQIQVIDTGKGINPQFVPYVFEYFRQEDGSTTRKFGGLGLGLAIARQIVELHGGRIWADSLGEGQGTTFTVRLPLLSNTSVELSSRELPASPPLPAPLAGVRVLVVDDDADTREFLKFLLQQAGAIVSAASSAAEALQLFETLNIDILFSDIGMPEMDGYELIRAIRALNTDKRSVPAIALTAYAGEVDQQQAITAGFQHHISKPIDGNLAIVIALELVR